MNRQFMRTLLVEESFAYGFTIAFWGSGLLLMGEYGFLGVTGILGYVVGSITVFGTLTLLTFGGAIDTVEFESSPRYFVLANVHYLAGVVPIVATQLLVDAPLTKAITLFVAGVGASVLYNVSAASRKPSRRLCGG